MVFLIGISIFVIESEKKKIDALIKIINSFIHSESWS